ncbi:glycine-rich cell wall structural protein-like isoform X2 [Zootermopsis nevadensis]|uniref:Uncharacterized protein n=1 Tax=Zootermopsis nevadensis TaxID=136037 RepID=A0A067QVM5_ZOONE|nr:glycine-rich cell wall structural protein-like isoform X2 [Zootermopsis nevadensis]KDR13217.1 hypothetical protein L798_13010 [Zootermopsis nevadensis]
MKGINVTEILAIIAMFIIVEAEKSESAVGVEIVAPTEGGQLQREKRSILLAKTLAFGKGLLIGKVAGIALGAHLGYYGGLYDRAYGGYGGYRGYGGDGGYGGHGGYGGYGGHGGYEAMITILAKVEANSEDPTARANPPVQAMVVAGEGEATPPARPVLLLLDMDGVDEI